MSTKTTKKKTPPPKVEQRVLPDRSKTYVRESRAFAPTLTTITEALGITRSALYTLGLTMLVTWMLPTLARVGLDKERLRTALREEFEQALGR